MWAGPKVRFPFSIKSLMEDSHYSTENTFSLVNDEEVLVGIGQILEKNQRLHIARIIVAPDLRGKGFGKDLCIHLIREGVKRFGGIEFSLNVNNTNTRAIHIYQTLGFKPETSRNAFYSNSTTFMLLKSGELI